MRLSGVAISNILHQQQESFLNGTDKALKYEYLIYEHKIVRFLLAGDITEAENLLLYDPSFGMGCNGADQYPRNIAILRTIQRSCRPSIARI